MNGDPQQQPSHEPKPEKPEEKKPGEPAKPEEEGKTA